MLRLILIHADREVEMPPGESYVGRAVECQLRFNDASISRRHLRFVCRDEGVFVENLSDINGAELNGARLSKSVQLRSGDQIEIGHRRLRVQLREQAATRAGALEVGPGLLIADELQVREADVQEGPAEWAAELNSAVPGQRNCPKCRSSVAALQPECPSCGYRWPFGGPASATQEIRIAEMMRRVSKRHIIRVPVIYSSEQLTLDCVARDLSAGGMFIASELLDPIGTRCDITALPDGRSALRFEAEVCHVCTEIVQGRPPGFGVRFRTMSQPAREWLDVVNLRKD